VKPILSKCSLVNKARGLDESSRTCPSASSRNTAMGVDPEGADGFQFGERLWSDVGSSGVLEPFLGAVLDTFLGAVSGPLLGASAMGGTFPSTFPSGCFCSCFDSWLGDAGLTATTMGTRRACCGEFCGPILDFSDGGIP